MSEDNNVWMFIGVIVVAISVGTMYSQPIGFLTLGSGIILQSLLNAFLGDPSGSC
jgi:hypothetical protein